MIGARLVTARRDLGRAVRAMSSVAVVAMAALAAPVRADDVGAWMNRLRGGGMQGSQEAAAALGRLGDPAVDALAELVRNGTALERRWACVALGAMSRPVTRAVAPLAIASADPDPDVRLAALDALSHWLSDQPMAATATEHALADGDANVRMRAAVALSSASEPPPRVEQVLLEGLHGGVVGVRVASLDGLARLATRSSDGAASVVAAQLGDPLAPIRSESARALASMRPAAFSTVAALCPRLDDPDPWVAMLTARALARVEAPVVDCAGARLASTEPEARRRAAWLLHARLAREPNAVLLLATRARDDDSVVRGYASSAAWAARANLASCCAAPGPRE